MKLVFKPEGKYVSQIKTWLQGEMLEKKSHYYYNFINSNINDENFVCYVDAQDMAIGYVNYNFSDTYTHIDVAVVQFEHQRKGIGRELLEAISERVRERGTKVLSLMCAPKTSAPKWKKLGFKNFKEVMNHQYLEQLEAENPFLYKIIVDAKQPTRKQHLQNYIALWAEPEYKVRSLNLNPSYRWDVTDLDNPIIYPVDGDWLIEYVRENVVNYRGVVKRFKQNSSPFGNFLVINELS